MELSPKQQSVELIKNSKRVLILGHKKPDGDFLGSGLALARALVDLEKNVELVISDSLPEIYQYLPLQDKVKKSLLLTQGKILRIDTKRIPVSGMRYQKNNDSLDIILEADKNLKFEYVEIINGTPKPDVIIVLDTPDVQKIDAVYDKNTELFFEVPIINIDHHAGNEYFGTVNLVDLTASSTAEILVSLFESLGVKIADPDTATCLLTGIIADTQSFRSQTTTPKSLTVAAQLLAAGGRQQEIISNLYKKRPMALMKLWGEMLSGISRDEKHHFVWTKVSASDLTRLGVTPEDVLEAADELLTNNPDAKMILVLCEKSKGQVIAKLKGAKGEDVLGLAGIFNGEGNNRDATFAVSGANLDEIELLILKKIHDHWTRAEEKQGESADGSLWDVVSSEPSAESLSVPQNEAEIEATTEGEHLSAPETEFEIESTTEGEILSHPETEAEVQTTTESKDVIDSALQSIAEEQLHKENTLTPLSGIIEQKKKELLKDEEIDVFDESE
jgi:phosphoesterase RecJ-like protein